MVPPKNKHRPSGRRRSVKDVPKPMNSWKVIDGSITKETSPGAENSPDSEARKLQASIAVSKVLAAMVYPWFTHR